VDTVVTSKGQVTIPKRVRDRLGIEPGNRVRFEMDEQGRFVLVKVGGRRRRSVFAKLRGIATAGLSTDEIMAMTRGEE
jgi:antitoxin PrlF